jgi:HK97 family phage major capsid protein
MTSYREFTSKFELYQKFYGRALDLVTILPTETGVTLPIPRFDDTNNKGRWLAEGGTVTNTDPIPTSITLGAYKASSDEVPLSVELLQDGQVAMGNLVPMLLGERIGRLKNEAVTVGTGTNQPYGIMTRATASGVVLAGTNASPTYDFDKFLDLKYSVDVAYRNAPAAKRGFMLNDAVLAKLRKLKDTNNRYLADPFTSGPGTIDGDPIHLNNDVLATGVSAKVAAYGDYSKYLWREVAAVTFMRLNEIRAREGKVVFLAWCRSDGDLINTSAVKTLANPAS